MLKNKTKKQQKTAVGCVVKKSAVAGCAVKRGREIYAIKIERSSSIRNPQQKAMDRKKPAGPCAVTRDDGSSGGQQN